MKIINGQRPPNFDKIHAVFPLASKPGVIFAYDGAIYNPSGGDLPEQLLVHESVHLKRQVDHEGGADGWWDDYLNNVNFRYFEELLAHRAEYDEAIKNATNRQQRRSALKPIAKRLSSALYGRAVTTEQAKKDILNV